MPVARALLATAALLAVAGVAAAQQDPAGQSALKRGVSAYHQGQQEAAIPALTEVAATGDASAKFLAEFFLARAYAEGAGAAANHTKAYVLYRKIADENVEVPERSQRAAYVAKALVALAGYVHSGLKEIDLAPNPRTAARYLEHAATYFGDRDAQYELARTYVGPGKWTAGEISIGLHYLSVLTQTGHASAQATLAELFWRGRHVRKDEARALALAGLALANAPVHERKWIEDTYGAIFCGMPAATREAAGGLARRWSRMLSGAAPESSEPAAATLLPERPCPDSGAIAMTPPPRAETIRSAGVLEAAAKKKK
jgi:TPR repeat protein